MNTRHLVDPQLGPFLDALPAFELSAETLAAVRAIVFPSAVDAAAVDAVAMSVRSVPGPPGGAEVGVIIYTPRQSTGPLPCIVHMHGGGYVAGSAASAEPRHRPLALAAGCVIVSVEYRLAPETTFPGAIEDCYAALAWTFANSRTLNIDARRIGVMGESAGGGLAAALALLARDRGEYPLAFQHLIYPMLDDRTCTTPDPHPHTGEFLWTAHKNAFGWASLLGVPPGSADVSSYAAAARAEDLSGLPPTFLSTGALDLFLEEDIEYARRLLRAGVPVELHVYPGAFHAFDLAPDAQVARDANRDSIAALRRALHTGH
ncbi:MAG TPA: alpha/beta hydrolase [Steroidobacteraceae bacterium]|nr:alpha/beta hydrolase [Steroidobacteraceae bacterium]